MVKLPPIMQNWNLKAGLIRQSCFAQLWLECFTEIFSSPDDRTGDYTPKQNRLRSRQRQYRLRLSSKGAEIKREDIDSLPRNWPPPVEGGLKLAFGFGPIDGLKRQLSGYTGSLLLCHKCPTHRRCLPPHIRWRVRVWRRGSDKEERSKPQRPAPERGHSL